MGVGRGDTHTQTHRDRDRDRERERERLIRAHLSNSVVLPKNKGQRGSCPWFP